MLVELSDRQAVLVSIVAWVLVGLATGYVWHRCPRRWLLSDNALTRGRSWEDDGRWYRRNLAIRRWKDLLPEKGDLFQGGFSKRHLVDRSTDHLERFVVETRRAELVHWSNRAAGPLFLLWCPQAIGAVMIVFGVVAHLPFIVIQRYNRARLSLLLERRRARAGN